MPENRTSRSLVSALVALLIGGIVTLILTFIVPTPWNVAEVLIAVGMSTFFGTFFGAYFAMRS